MLLAIAVAVLAVGLGLSFGLMPQGAAKAMGLLRTFALCSALSVAATHLLPEAFETLGGAGVLAFAAGLALPAGLGAVRSRRGGHAHVALAFGYVGLLVHHVADGLALGAYAGHAFENLDVLLALAMHTVPLVAVVALAYRDDAGVRTAVVRSAGLALASTFGVLVSEAVPREKSQTLDAWIAAAVAGLLVHVITHDLERDLPSTSSSRVLDLLAAVAGVSLSLLAVPFADISGVFSGLGRLGDAFGFMALPLLLGFVLNAAFQTKQREVGLFGACVFGFTSAGDAARTREDPAPALAFGAQSFAALATAVAARWDVVLIALWLAGPLVEIARLLGVLALALLGVRLLSGQVAARSTRRIDVALALPLKRFAQVVTTTSPWLFTGIVLAVLLDVSLKNGSLAWPGHDGLLALGLVVLAFPVQFDAAAAAPVLAVAVSKGLSPATALAAWIAVAAPGERALAALGSRSGSRLAIYGTKLVAALCGYALALLSNADFRALGNPKLERLGYAAALILALPVLTRIWQRGLRGWLSVVFRHDHDHATT